MTERFIPKNVDEITADWLTKALTDSGVLKNNSVSKVDVNIIGEGQGYVGTLARLTVEYSKPDKNAPSSMIAKIPTEEPKSKMIMEAFWNYERENRLYDEILDQLPIRTPRCYYSAFDEGKGKEWMDHVYGRYGKLPVGLVGLYFIYAGIRNLRLKRRYILLLEDFGGWEQISHLGGCSIEDAEMVMKPLGEAHASFWESPLLVNKYWFKDHANITNMMIFLSNRWQPIVKKSFPEKLSEKSREVLAWLKNNNKKLDDYTKARPHTLIHTDYRLDNIFFNRKNKEIAIIDWQASCPGLGLFDPAFFILNNCTESITPEITRELIAVYHQGLVDGGVSNYSLDECLSDYVYGFLLALRYWLIIIGGIEVEKDPNAQKLLGVVLERMNPQIEAMELPKL